jgi:uncharacterized protein (UPF0548 family)
MREGAISMHAYLRATHRIDRHRSEIGEGSAYQSEARQLVRAYNKFREAQVRKCIFE